MKVVKIPASDMVPQETIADNLSAEDAQFELQYESDLWVKAGGYIERDGDKVECFEPTGKLSNTLVIL